MNDTLSLTNPDTSINPAADSQEQEEPSQIDWTGIWKPLGLIVGGFLLFFFLPIDSARFSHSVIEALALAKWYAREHVLLCLVPALLYCRRRCRVCFPGRGDEIPGAPGPARCSHTGWASVSGSILAVCSCTILPLFAGIWKRGAGLGPAIVFLYSGPAIKRTGHYPDRPHTGAGDWNCPRRGGDCLQHRHRLCMHLMFRKEEQAKAAAAIHMPETGGRTAAVADHPFVCCHGGAAGVGHLGKTRTRPAVSGRPSMGSNGSWPVASPSLWAS